MILKPRYNKEDLNYLLLDEIFKILCSRDSKKIIAKIMH